MMNVRALNYRINSIDRCIHMNKAVFTIYIMFSKLLIMQSKYRWPRTVLVGASS
jgi:hypothetical protein